MKAALRRTGIDIIGDVRWGTHFCHFFETKQDLLDTLIPYFKAGLEDKEYCLWLISEPLTVQEARIALGKTVPDIDRYLAEQSVELLPHVEWFLETGSFDLERIINGLREKLDRALARGYPGMRFSGNPSWLRDMDHKAFVEYERALDKLTTKRRMLVSCIYPLATSGAVDVFETAQTHLFAGAMRHGKWEVVETPELKQTKSELARMNKELEERVDIRTRELAATADDLRRKIFSCERAEEALKKSDEELRALFAAMTDVILVLDAEGRYVKIAPTNPLNLYRPSEDLLGKTIHQIIPQEDADKILFQIKRALASRKTIDFEYKLNIGLREVWFESRISPLTEDSVFWIARDISERKRAEGERREMEERLNRAEKMEAVGMLAGGVAHDLNNVLGILVGYSELLADNLDGTSPLRTHVDYIRQGGERAAAIVQDLLTLARRGVQASEIVNLNSIIDEFQDSPEFENICSFHPNVRIETVLENRVLNIKGSLVHLHKTVMNLVSNAAEAMPAGGRIVIRTENRYIDRPVPGYDHIREGDYVVLSVSDTGEGIAEKDLKKIFEPFYTKKVMGRSGTGLGLSVVWATVKDHNGYINVQSEEGRGTTFSLYFPATREVLRERVSVPKSMYLGHSESILVVDDIQGQRELAARMLEKLNYQVTIAADGEEAVEYLKTHQVDLVVLDMIMDPGMDGLDTYREILKLRPKQKAIVVSGFSESDRVKQAQALGAGAYVRKPYVSEILGIAVRNELDRSG
jgi:PAS domain S-box-containing protein